MQSREVFKDINSQRVARCKGDTPCCLPDGVHVLHPSDARVRAYRPLATHTFNLEAKPSAILAGMDRRLKSKARHKVFFRE